MHAHQHKAVAWYPIGDRRSALERQTMEVSATERQSRGLTDVRANAVASARRDGRDACEPVSLSILKSSLVLARLCTGSVKLIRLQHRDLPCDVGIHIAVMPICMPLQVV